MARWPNYPGDELTEDWKKVLFNQFHDLAAGSGIGIIYKDAQKDYDVVRSPPTRFASRARYRRRAHQHRGRRERLLWSSIRSAGTLR